MFVNVQEKLSLNLKFLISGGEIHRKPNWWIQRMFYTVWWW